MYTLLHKLLRRFKLTTYFSPRYSLSFCFFLSENDLRSKLAQRGDLFLSEISEQLERCSKNSELFLNSWSSENIIGFCWAFEIRQYFSEYFSEERSQEYSQIFSWRMWNTVAILAQVARISPSLPRLLTIVRSRGARCSDLSKPKFPRHLCPSRGSSWHGEPSSPRRPDV